jgi:hypothetical protein
VEEQTEKPKRAQTSKEQKRLLAEETTRVAREDAEARRAAREVKTTKLRALRMARERRPV